MYYNNLSAPCKEYSWLAAAFSRQIRGALTRCASRITHPAPRTTKPVTDERTLKLLRPDEECGAGSVHLKHLKLDVSLKVHDVHRIGIDIIIISAIAA